MKILMIVNAPAYGSERMLSALRLATALMTREREDQSIEMAIFMMSDAVTVGLPDQNPSDNRGSLQTMLDELLGRGVQIRLCRTCALARGLASLPLIAGIEIATLADLAEFTLRADKVITF